MKQRLKRAFSECPAEGDYTCCHESMFSLMLLIFLLYCSQIKDKSPYLVTYA